MSEVGGRGDVRGEVDVGDVQQWVGHVEGFGFVDIEHGERGGVGDHEIGEGDVVEDEAARGVDEDDVVFAVCEIGGGDEAVVGGTAIDVDREHVGLFAEFSARNGRCAVAFAGGHFEQVVVDGGDAERLGDAGEGGADAAQAPDAQRELAELAGGAEFLADFSPAVVVDGLAHEEARAGGVEEEGEDVFDDGVGVGIGGVDDAHAAGVAGGEVDVVEANTGAADDLESLRAGEHVGGDFGVGANDEAVGVSELIGELGGVVRDDAEVASVGEPGGGFRIEVLGLEDDRLGHGV